ncbi:DUF3311 domain-containing protein [Streptomyces sp. NPDC051940]|uniref:DUF3311 domain-containing protein n=1 Tax=Streptomyces sp. NPDC051940 TaxID=3155675 RepID=UPI00341AEFF4
MFHRSHLWLLAPFGFYCVALPWANRLRPAPGGVPFLWLWLAGATLLTPAAVWLAYRGDKRRGGRG